MPVLPPGGGGYDTVDTVLKFMRVLANDADVTLAGDLLADTQPYTYTLLQLAHRKLQDRLDVNSVESFPEETIIIGLAAMPAAALGDLSTQSVLSFDGYFNGAGSSQAPVLPQDLLVPLKVWERPSNQLMASFTPMVNLQNGLPTRPKSGSLLQWEWRDDALNFVGASQSIDLRLRYRRQLAVPSSPDTSIIPILDCAVALSYLGVEIFATSRGGSVSKEFSAQGEKAILQLINKTTRRKQRLNNRRRPYSGRGYR